VLQTPTAHEDILPTILNLAGVDIPSDLDGQPLPLPITPSAGYKQPGSKFEQ
jgi:arylsulfatase A-like enzyme